MTWAMVGVGGLIGVPASAGGGGEETVSATQDFSLSGGACMAPVTCHHFNQGVVDWCPFGCIDDAWIGGVRFLLNGHVPTRVTITPLLLQPSIVAFPVCQDVSAASPETANCITDGASEDPWVRGCGSVDATVSGIPFRPALPLWTFGSTVDIGCKEWHVTGTVRARVAVTYAL